MCPIQLYVVCFFRLKPNRTHQKSIDQRPLHSTVFSLARILRCAPVWGCLTAPLTELGDRRDKGSLVCKAFEQPDELSPQNKTKTAEQRKANQTISFVKRGAEPNCTVALGLSIVLLSRLSFVTSAVKGFVGNGVKGNWIWPSLAPQTALSFSFHRQMYKVQPTPTTAGTHLRDGSLTIVMG